MNDWKEFLLSDITEIIGGGTPKRSNPDYWNGNIPWLSVRDFNDSNRYVSKSEEFISKVGLKNSSTKLLKPGQLIISARGTVGALAQLTKEMAFNQSCYGLNGKDNLVINDYLYYLVKHSIERLQKITHGAVFDTITKDTFDHIKVKIPPIEVQQKIADILGTLDDKIELNRQMNQTLEAMARAIFKSWFVDFDPVYAKMEGRDYPLPPEIMDLFPDELEESELGLIPKGWEVGKIQDLTEKIENGGTPKRNNLEYWDNGTIPWLTSGEVRSKIITNTQNFITEKGLKNSSAKMWQNGTVIVALYGATAGEVCRISMELCANQACCGLSPNKHASNYLYIIVSNSSKKLSGLARGSAQQNLSKDLVSNYPVIIPSDDVLNKFNDLTSPMFHKQENNLLGNAILEKTRFQLLPRLLSGRINY